MDKSKLYNIGAGGLISHPATEYMFSHEEKGKEMIIDFKTRINGTQTDDKMLFDPVTKSKLNIFSTSAVKPTITVNRKVHDVILQKFI